MFRKCILSISLFLIFVHFSSNQLFAQEEEGEVIIVSERVGEEIDKEERDKYELFPHFKDFHSAVLLKMPDNIHVFKITQMDKQTGELKIERIQASEESIKDITGIIKMHCEKTLLRIYKKEREQI